MYIIQRGVDHIKINHPVLLHRVVVVVTLAGLIKAEKIIYRMYTEDKEYPTTLNVMVKK